MAPLYVCSEDSAHFLAAESWSNTVSDLVVKKVR
jgi:hypothetical protein